jgi:hypothetical protein
LRMSREIENKVLDRAIALIRDVGWVQGTPRARGPDGCLSGFCMIGALDYATHDKEDPELCNPAYRQDIFFTLRRRVLRALETTGYGSIGVWNDQPERTKEQVLEVLQRVREQ